MNNSLTTLQQISHTMLEDRLETVKELQKNDIDTYEIVKDRQTGEHYLLYFYVHLNIAEGGHKETYYHLLPIESDDVLAFIFGEQKYDYPEHWHRTFLRNSSDDNNYVWFDPSFKESYEQYEALGQQMKDILLDFKKQGNLDEAAMKRLMDRLDDL